LVAKLSVLACEGLYAGYGKEVVVRDLNLRLDAGEVVSLLGPNGAGKTTTLLTLVGLLPVLGGSVSVFGHVLGGRKAHLIARSGVSLVPDDRALFPGLTTRENLETAMSGRKADVDAVIDYFPALRPRLNLAAGMLSGGEQQMLALARALVTVPKVLLIDEMSMGLAPTIAQEMLRIVRRIADERDVAVLLVEQHVNLALTVADRGIVMVHGEVRLEGPAADLLSDRERLEESYMGGKTRPGNRGGGANRSSTP
jgi:branched-chain amino acid transport system ATP-binding protein